MELYGKFNEKGYDFEAYWPSSDRDRHEWILRAYKDGSLVKEVTEPIFHPTLFGVDVDDAANLERITDELIKELTGE